MTDTNRHLSDLDGLGAHEQPLPHYDPRGVPVLPLAVAPLRHNPRTRWAIAALEERTRIGVARYGQPLHTHNGRDPVEDLRQEILDAWQYFTQACAEGLIDPDDAAVMEADLTSLLVRLAPKETEPCPNRPSGRRSTAPAIPSATPTTRSRRATATTASPTPRAPQRCRCGQPTRPTAGRSVRR